MAKQKLRREPTNLASQASNGVRVPSSYEDLEDFEGEKEQAQSKAFCKLRPYHPIAGETVFCAEVENHPPTRNVNVLLVPRELVSVFRSEMELAPESSKDCEDR